MNALSPGIPFTISEPVTNKTLSKPTPKPALHKSMKDFAAVPQGFSLISNRKLLELYTAMLACRQLGPQTGDKTGSARRDDSIHGHEAAVVGAAIYLLAHDAVAHSLWPDGAMQAINPAVASAPGYQAALRRALAAPSPAGVIVLFSSAKKSAQTSWAAAVAQAAEHNLPALFVQMHHPSSAAEPFRVESLTLKRKGYTLPSINVDGNDVVAMYRVATESITHARKGHGPTFIDCRLSIAADPLTTMQAYLTGKGLDQTAFEA
jgi:TPP-dependent pyruvate/acetoin dehydrogenase alpha subunit